MHGVKYGIGEWGLLETKYCYITNIGFPLVIENMT